MADDKKNKTTGKITENDDKIITVVDYIDTLVESAIKKAILKKTYNYMTELKTIKDWTKIIK
jgi:trans-aconitate methyltransferase